MELSNNIIKKKFWDKDFNETFFPFTIQPS